MAARVRSKQVSPTELVQAHLARIDRINPKINAFVSRDPEHALQEARAAEAAVARGAELGPLHGVPVTIKSSIDVAGFRCETGTKLRAGNVASQDAPLVMRLRAAGAIVLGNTNVPEMLVSYTTDNLLYGRTNNPWDLERTPGGSSGGEAAAIAACCSAAGVGSDGGGSIRVPAHFSGICGLKPTPGRIPITGHFPQCVGPFAFLGVVGPMARTVRDLELLLEVMAGSESGDVCAAPVPFRRVSDAEARKTRIGWFEDDGVTRVTPETRAAVRAAAGALEQQGFEVVPFLPQGLEKARQLWWTFFGPVGGLMLGPTLAGHESELSPTLREFVSLVSAEAPPTLEGVLNAWVGRDLCRSALLAQMENFPVLLCPVSTGPAARHGQLGWTQDAGRVSFLETMRYSQWFNLTGNPAAVVPAGRSPEGLPIGVQIVGRPYEEEMVLAIAGKIEQALGGWREPPIE
ncbi:MAG: amidase [Acidobacteria bacterium]|nr:amidase [Acidobacteriota bacterium]